MADKREASFAQGRNRQIMYVMIAHEPHNLSTGPRKYGASTMRMPTITEEIRQAIRTYSMGDFWRINHQD
jgi:hypothetical protein